MNDSKQNKRLCRKTLKEFLLVWVDYSFRIFWGTVNFPHKHTPLWNNPTFLFLLERRCKKNFFTFFKISSSLLNTSLFLLFEYIIITLQASKYIIQVGKITTNRKKHLLILLSSALYWHKVYNGARIKQAHFYLRMHYYVNCIENGSCRMYNNNNEWS